MEVPNEGNLYVVIEPTSFKIWFVRVAIYIGGRWATYRSGKDVSGVQMALNERRNSVSSPMASNLELQGYLRLHTLQEIEFKSWMATLGVYYPSETRQSMNTDNRLASVLLAFSASLMLSYSPRTNIHGSRMIF